MLVSLVKSFTSQSIRVGGRRRAVAFHSAAAINSRSSVPSSASLSSASAAPSSTVGSVVAQSSLTTSWMSSSPPGDGETSVVETCREKIAVALETDDVKVIGAYDDPNGSHISIEVTSALFEGKRPVQRQQLVYKAL
ncbi:hypothetical protein ACHAXR_000390, partial [Thalassiosira sp. AJA248-18]